VVVVLIDHPVEEEDEANAHKLSGYHKQTRNRSLPN
jgi:hypothetical protein